MANALTRTHKTTGWTRTPEGFGIYRIGATDGTPDRRVKFLSPGTWQNDPGDDRANIGTPRVLLLDGPALPPWAVEWLDKINARQCERAQDDFRAALDDAALHSDSRDGW